MATDLLQLDFVVKQVGLDKALTQTAKFEREIMKTVKAYQRGQITQDRYQKSLLNTKRQMAALTDENGKQVMSIHKANQAVQRFIATQDNLNKSLVRQQSAVKSAYVAQEALGKGMNRTGVIAQQAGYQFGDFFVQVQSGTNVMVAFGQQATQLIGTFAMLAKSTRAIMLLSGLGVVVPILTAIAAGIMRTKEAAEGAEEKVKTFEDRLRSSQTAIDSAQNSVVNLTNEGLENLREKFGAVTTEVIALEDRLNRIELKAMTTEIQEAMNSLFSPEFFSAIEDKFGAIGSAIAESTTEEIEFTRQEIKYLEQTIQNSDFAMPELEGQLVILREELAAMTGDFENMGSLKDELTLSHRTIETYKELETAIKSATAEGNFQAAADGISKMLLLFEGVGIEIDSGALANMSRLEAVLREAVATLDDAGPLALTLSEYFGDAADEAQRMALNLQQAAMSAEQTAEGNITVMVAQMKALNAGQDEYIAGARARLNLEKAAYQESLVAAGLSVKEAQLATESNFKHRDAALETTEAYRELQGSLKEVGKKGPKSGEDTRTAYEKAMMTAKEFADALDRQVIGAVDGVADAFSTFLQNGMKDFKSFVGSIKDMFIRLLADMAAMALKRQILIPIAAGFAGGFGSAAAGATTANLIAGGGMAGSLAAGASSFGAGLQASLGMGGFTSAGVFNVGANAAVATAATGAGASAAMATLGAAVPMIAAGVALFSLFGKKKKPAISAENMNKVNQALMMTGQELGATGREAEQAAAALGEVAGGFDKLTKKSQAYFENFYTEGERRAIAATEATQALNKTFADLELAVPKTHAEFRQLVEAQDLMTDAGRKTYNALLDVSGAFVTLKGTADQANQAIKLGRAREREQRARSAPIFTERFISEEMVNQQIETLGTTAELNEYLLRGLDNYLSIQNIPASARREQLDKVKEQFDGFLEDTTYVQNIQREFYEGIRKPIQEVKNMLRKVGASKQERTQYELYGDISSDLMNKMTERFGKYFEYNVLPYTTQLELFIKETSQVIGKIVESIRTTNFRGDLGVLNRKIEVSADRVSVGYAALASGYRKIVEAVDKVEDYYERDFANLRTEYTGAAGLESSTAVKSITDRISSIIELPKRLVAIIESSMDTLSKQADKLDGAFTKVQQEYFKVKYSGLQVSEGLQESYRDMLANRQAAAKAAAEAQKRVEELTLFIRTIEGAVQGFKDSVERVVTSPIEDALAVFLPTELDSLAQNVRTQIKEILGSMGEGTLDTFETGLVTLSDLLASNTITVDQFNNSFKLMQDVFEGNISLTDQYTTKQQSVVEKLSSAYDDFTSKLQNLLGVVRSGIESLVGQATDVNAVANRRGSLAYLRAVASTGQVDASRLESAVGVVTSGDISGFGTRQEFLRYVADTTSLLRTVEGTLSGQLETLEMQQVKAILNIQDTNETAATSLQSIQALLAEFLGVGGRIPTFATGGYHSGGLRIVGERGPELEATGPSRIIPAGQFSMGGDAELRREVAELRVDLKAALVQIAKNTRKSSDTLNKFDYQGLPNSRGY